METLPFVFLTKQIINPFISKDLNESSPFLKILQTDKLHDFIRQWYVDNRINDNVNIISDMMGSTKFKDTKSISDTVKFIALYDTKLKHVVEKLFESNCSGTKTMLSDLVWGNTIKEVTLIKPIEFIKINETQCTEDSTIINFKLDCYKMTLMPSTVVDIRSVRSERNERSEQNDKIEIKFCYISGNYKLGGVNLF
jgi:hypothetical protein